MHVTRHAGPTSGGRLHWIQRPSQPLVGWVLLLADDILDQGITLAEMARDCRERGAREVLSAALVANTHEKKCGFWADFVGLEVEDRYVFGDGMKYRAICAAPTASMPWQTIEEALFESGFSSQCADTC